MSSDRAQFDSRSVEPIPGNRADRKPDAQSEARLIEIRREAERRGMVEAKGIRPGGAPIPRASAETGYYGIPLLKEPQWTWEIPLYFFIGGVAGAASVIGAMADWVGDDYELANHARWIAVGGSVISGFLLIADLGRHDRFLNMLRIFKPQSPMSVGAWVLTGFGTFNAASAFAKTVQQRWDWVPVRVIGNLSQAMGAAFGLPFHNYTGVLIGATAIPVWNKNVGTLPMHFGMSGIEAAVSTLELFGHDDSRALSYLGLLSTCWETYEGINLETRRERVLLPLKRGKSGWITRIGGLLSGPLPLALRLSSAFSSGELSRKTRRLASLSGVAGSLLTRYGWLYAGHASARDWRLPLDIPKEAGMPKYSGAAREGVRAEKIG